jgi:hypothetical protein
MLCLALWAIEVRQSAGELMNPPQDPLPLAVLRLTGQHGRGELLVNDDAFRAAEWAWAGEPHGHQQKRDSPEGPTRNRRRS